MSDIEHQLQKVVFHRKRYRERRHKNNMLQIALVGYTNAGKSTLLNRLTSASTLTEDQLFATLDPTTKQLQLPSGMPVLITDTVGFIQNLPTTLVAAFRSTLEEVKEADLLLHVMDSTDENIDVYMDVVHRLLAELEAAHIPVIHVYNKKDRVPADGLVVHEEDLYISAFHEHDLQRVKDTIDLHFRSRMKCEKLRIPVSGAPRLLARMRKQGWIERLNWSTDGDYYEVEAFLWPHHSLEKEIDPFRL
jgi:GTPase